MNESVRFARSLESAEIAYLSVMGGTYESFFLQDIVHCSPDCGDTCTKPVMKKKAAFCVKWPHDKLKQWKN